MRLPSVSILLILAGCGMAATTPEGPDTASGTTDRTDPNDGSGSGSGSGSGGPPTLQDADGDTFQSDVDCDDSDAAIFPGANEVCDEVDNDCDGTADEGLAYVQLRDA